MKIADVYWIVSPEFVRFGIIKSFSKGVQNYYNDFIMSKFELKHFKYKYLYIETTNNWLPFYE